SRLLRLYSQEVVELGHGVSFLLLLPAADDVCSAPGQSNAYTPLSGFLHLPLQMFELVHFCTYKEKFIGLYCRLSSVLDLDALITQQALREAISDSEVSSAKQRHQLILDYIQQLDEVRRDLRWITDALQFARYRQPRGGVPVSALVNADAPPDSEQKTDSTSSNNDFLPTPSPSPEPRRRKPPSDSLLGSDEDGSSEVFLPTDSDYDSSDALSPRDLDLLYSPPQHLSQQALHSLGGSAPDVLQTHELRYSVCPPSDLPLSSTFFPLSPSPSKDFPLSPLLPLEDLSPLSPNLRPLSPLLPLEDLSPLSPPLRPLCNPPSKRKLLSRSQRGGGGAYFTPRWLRGEEGGEGGSLSLSEGVYTQQTDLPPPIDSPIDSPTFVSHASCVLESRRGRQRGGGQGGGRPHVRRIFVGGERGEAAGVSVVVEGGEEGGAQEVDSDEQTNAQVSEILSSSL
ncbi:hypothetical protein JOQ06_027781, partial [Pogonophryne albipinna]